MLSTFLFYAIPFCFTLLVACALTSLVCGIYLFVFRIRPTNQEFKHPYLSQAPWERYPMSIRLAMLLDYFFRIAFPRSHFWIVGNANRLLGHVNPEALSTRIKWPLIGLWGGCFTGVITMLFLWLFIFLRGF